MYGWKPTFIRAGVGEKNPGADQIRTGSATLKLTKGNYELCWQLWASSEVWGTLDLPSDPSWRVALRWFYEVPDLICQRLRHHWWVEVVVAWSPRPTRPSVISRPHAAILHLKVFPSSTLTQFRDLPGYHQTSWRKKKLTPQWTNKGFLIFHSRSQWHAQDFSVGLTPLLPSFTKWKK